MRFAYIDSQGNEVPIPSIDALALRIELGAVGPDTELYDAQADHWGPANTHEIFHSLARAAEGDGFVAPPPPVASAPTETAEPEVEAAEPEPEPEPDEEPVAGDVDLGLTLADPMPTPEEEVEEVAVDEGAGVADMALDLAPAVEEPPAVAEAPLAEEGGGGFDFGDLSTGLEMEEPVVEDTPPVAGVGGGLGGLETEMEFSSPVDDLGGSGDLQLEQPMSAFEPDSPPGWMDETEATDEVMDFSAVSAEDEAADQETVAAAVTDVPTRQRRTPKDRPSAPKFKKERSLSGPIVFVVLLLAIGVGGYVGWPILSARLAERSAPDRPAVVMPSIPEELMPRMRAIGEAAIADVVAEVSASTAVGDAPSEPPDDWLAGVYLGNASQYASVEAFWSSIGDFTEGLRAAEWQAYHDRYVARAGQEGLEAAAVAQVTERADSGFVAAQPQRAEAYSLLESLVEASLTLHDYLLQNEDAIVHRPGVTNSNDPDVDAVLEVAAPSQHLTQMLEMFDEITGSLTALGSLDRVTRDRLVEAMTARLQQVGLQ